MQSEKNKKTLEEAIKRLPHYVPPGEVWQNIEYGLQYQEQEQKLTSAIRNLPLYSPPAAVWDDIRAEIKAGKKTRMYFFRPVWRKVAAAAVFTGLILGSIYLFRFSNKTSINYTYTEENANKVLLVNDWDQDEEAFSLVLGIFSTRPLARKNEEYQSLKSEMEKLNSAKKELVDLMELYGTDAEIIKQIGSIERQRSEVLKKLAVFI